MTQQTKTVITIILIVILVVSLVIRFLKLWYADRFTESEIEEEYETLAQKAKQSLRKYIRT